jgi:hypothetical protein
MAPQGRAKLIGWGWRIIECSKEGSVVDWLQHRTLVRGNGLSSSTISGIHREHGVIDTGKSGRTLDGLLDAGLGAKVHPLRATLINLRDIVVK